MTAGTQGRGEERLDVLAYLRVSTEEQGRSGLGLDAQRAAIEGAAAYKGWRVVEWVTDEGYSGKTLERPGIQRALALLEDGGPDVLVVAKLDRLSRSLLDFAKVMERAKDEGWQLVVLDPELDMTSANGRLFANILASFAEWEREIIGERTSAALQRAKARGKRLGGTRVPPHVARRIRDMREAGASLTTIADELTRDEVPTARKGQRWYASTVRSVLERQ